MLKAYQYRLYPTKAQISTLNRTFDLCRKVYNNTLALRRDMWDYDQKSLTFFDTTKDLLIWKKENPELKTVHSQVLQNVQVRVDLAFKAFFKRAKKGCNPGYPRFKSFGRYDSITYPQAGDSLDVQNQTVSASKIGKMKAVIHRPCGGTIKTMTIRKSSTGKWYVSFAVEQDLVVREHVGDEVTGIDLGLTTFAMLSNGESIENPRFFQTDENALAKAQHRMSKEVKGSPERRIRRMVVSKIHERISNRRKNFVHQESKKLIDRFKTIAFENLNIKNMQQTSHLAKGVADVSWGMMVRTTKNKAVEAGSRVVLVNPKNTTQFCSRCGQYVRKELSDRIHSCPQCGLVMDRDQNAAINILRLGLQSLSACHAHE
jgi:putative transposase